MKTAIVIWTAAVMTVMVMIIVAVTKNQNFTGSDITLETKETKQFTINAAAPVTVEAASNLFFAFRNGSATVVGTLTANPLGWNRNEYYTTGPVPFSGGLWVVEKGSSVTVHLTSPESMVIQEGYQPVENATNVFAIVFMSMIVWAFGTLIIIVANE